MPPPTPLLAALAAALTHRPSGCVRHRVTGPVADPSATAVKSSAELAGLSAHLAGAIEDQPQRINDRVAARSWVNATRSWSRYTGSPSDRMRVIDRPSPSGVRTGLPMDRVLRSRARPQLIREQYDDMLRTAGSLKRGWIPASLLITRLKNATPQTPLAAALGDYGRIVRTSFILGDCADPAQTLPDRQAAEQRREPARDASAPPDRLPRPAPCRRG